MKIRRTHIAVIGLIVVAVTGCATFKSSKVIEGGKPKSEQREGIVYFLPRARINVRATLGGGGGGAQAADKAAAQNNNTINVVINNGEKKPDAAGSAPSAGSGGDTKPQTFYQITIKEVYEPDPKQMFLLRPQFNCLSADSYRVSVNNGLLTTIASTNADKTGDVLIDLAKIGVESFKLASGVPSFGPRLRQATNTPPKEFDLTFDPTDENEFLAASNTLKSAELTLTIANSIPNFGKGWTKLDVCKKSSDKEFDGFFYRPALPYTVSIKNTDESVIMKTVFLPNEAPIVSYSPQRSPMVERVTSISLENGILKEVYVSKPSSIQAGVKVPLTVLQSVIALPTDLIQLKLNYSTADKNLADAQKNELDAMRGLLDAQRKFLDAQTNGVSGQK